MKTRTLNTTTIVVSVISVVFSFVSLLTSIISNNIADESKTEARRASDIANKISQDNLRLYHSNSAFERNMISAQMADIAYDYIFENTPRSNSIKILNSSGKIEDMESMDEVINSLEDVGSKYCKGMIYEQNIREKFARTLSSICYSEPLSQRWSGKKNGTALLCYKLFDGSNFGNTFKKDTLKTCHIIKSQSH